MYLKGDTIGGLWLELLRQLHQYGHHVSPRGLACREFTGVTLRLSDVRNNIFSSAIRKVSYRFMVAEALWIFFGHNDVATIAPYNPKIAQFSDDGVIFDGAYGPWVQSRWKGIINILEKDPDSRQAVLPIYHVPKGPTKDVSCTLSITFFNRQDRIETVVSMRSSDTWLGLPYDVFLFTSLANILAAQLGVDTGGLTLHLGSSHLYDVNSEAAKAILAGDIIDDIRSPKFTREPPTWLDDVLTKRDPWFDPFLKPWDGYAQVLLAESNTEALKVLKTL
jgi:thymidylate synthase